MQKIMATPGRLTLARRAILALAVGATLAVGGWGFAQDKPAAPPAPVAPAPAPPPSKLDPAGTATGTIGDISAKDAGKPTPAEIADQIGHNKVSINVMWTLLAGFLVMFMQAGFGLPGGHGSPVGVGGHGDPAQLVARSGHEEDRGDHQALQAG